MLEALPKERGKDWGLVYEKWGFRKMQLFLMQFGLLSTRKTDISVSKNWAFRKVRWHSFFAFHYLEIPVWHSEVRNSSSLSVHTDDQCDHEFTTSEVPFSITTSGKWPWLLLTLCFCLRIENKAFTRDDMLQTRWVQSPTRTFRSHVKPDDLVTSLFTCARAEHEAWMRAPFNFRSEITTLPDWTCTLCWDK